MVRLSSVLFATGLFGASVIAHPGHDIQDEIRERAAFLSSPEYRSLDHCAEAIKARDGELIERRRATVERLRQKRAIEKRDFNTVLNTNHKSSKAVTPQSSYLDIFGSVNSCILQPETTEGPYYVRGESVRRDIREDEKGVDLIFDVLLIDTTTCKPLPAVALEAWACNSTGVYGGVVANGNGNRNDATNIDNTALRGVQVSDSSGVLQFETIYPVLAHIGATVLPNNTLTGGHISHVGQLFFDQDLSNSVETTSPYNTNRQSLTLNRNDGIFAQEAATSDPVLNYVLLGNTVSSGVFGWVTVGINPTVSKTVNAAAYIDANGGHAT